MADRAERDILIVGGSAEAHALTGHLAERAIVVLPEPERRRRQWQVPIVAGFAAVEVPKRLLGIVDASHPCDRRASEFAAESALRARVPLLRLERPGWRAGRLDHWQMLRREEDAVRHVGSGARVFLATGRASLRRFANLRDCYVLSRQMSAFDLAFPLPRGRFLHGAAPFTVAGEVALMRRHAIDWLILRNAGGPGGWPKLAAARHLALRVGLLARPVLPPAPVVHSVAAALQRIAAWDR